MKLQSTAKCLSPSSKLKGKAGWLQPASSSAPQHPDRPSSLLPHPPAGISPTQPGPHGLPRQLLPHARSHLSAAASMAIDMSLPSRHPQLKNNFSRERALSRSTALGAHRVRPWRGTPHSPTGVAADTSTHLPHQQMDVAARRSQQGRAGKHWLHAGMVGETRKRPAASAGGRRTAEASRLARPKHTRASRSSRSPDPAARTAAAPAAGSKGNPALPSTLLCFVVLIFFFFKQTGVYLFLQSLPTHKPNLGSKQKCMNRRSETKQEAGRAALLPPALTSPHGARRLYLGTATVCGAAAPLGHGAECRFSRQQTTTAPSKPLEAAAPRPAHRCFDSHSPATTALDSPRHRHALDTRPRFRLDREGGGKGSRAPHGGDPLSSLPFPPRGQRGQPGPRASRRGPGMPGRRETEAARRRQAPTSTPRSCPGASSRPKHPWWVGRSRELAGRAQPPEQCGGPARGRDGGSRWTQACSRPTSPASPTRPPARGPHSRTKAEAQPRSGEGKREP